MKGKKLLKIFSIFIFLIGVLFIVIYKSPIGESILKNYISSKLTLIKKFDIESFTYKLNSFSLVLKKGSNYIYVYGDLLPFDATYEANFNDLEEINPEFRGELQSKGSIVSKDKTYIKGNALFAKGYGELNLECFKHCSGGFNGSDFDLQSLFYMLKINFPYILGNIDFVLDLKENLNITYDFLGNLKYKGLFFKNVKIKGNGGIVDKEHYSADMKVFHKFFEGNLSLKNNGSIFYKGKAFIYLKVLQPIILYPLDVKENIKFIYDQSSGILKFFSQDFTGYKINDEINIQLNKLDFKKFFRFIGMPPLADGKISGNITIENKGEFNLIANNFKVLDTKTVRFIENKIKRRLTFLRVAFLKGNFDKKRVIFDFLAKNEGFLISIQKGIYFYSGKKHFRIEVISNNIKYLFIVNDSNIKLVKKAKSYKLKQEILVY